VVCSRLPTKWRCHMATGVTSRQQRTSAPGNAGLNKSGMRRATSPERIIVSSRTCLAVSPQDVQGIRSCCVDGWLHTGSQRTGSQLCCLTSLVPEMQIGVLYPSYERRRPWKHQFVACSLYQAWTSTRSTKPRPIRPLATNKQYWLLQPLTTPIGTDIALRGPRLLTQSLRVDALYDGMLQGWFYAAETRAVT
jgi:hypothetical protein